MKGIPISIGILLVFTIMNLINIGESRLFMTPNNWLMNAQEAATEKLESVSHQYLGAMKSDQFKKSSLQMVEEQNPKISFLLVPRVSFFYLVPFKILFVLIYQISLEKKLNGLQGNFCILNTDIAWGLLKLGLILESKVPLNLKLAKGINNISCLDD